MKRTALMLTGWLLALLMLAQNPTQLLDQSAAALRSAGNVKIGFTFEGDGGSQTGYIKLQKQKFVLNMGGTITWFDGKTMWTYVRANEEVNVTTPTAAAVAKMNPYAFLSFYKHGYTPKMGSGTGKEHEVVLTGSDGTSYKKAVVRISKSTKYPTRITMTTAKDVTTTIHCNSIQKNQKYTDSTFRFNKKNYPDAEVVDLR